MYRDADVSRPPLVLLAESSEDYRGVLAAAFHLAGWQVASASDGVEASFRASELRPDALVVELFLPGRDGFDVAQAVRENARTAVTPIIALVDLLLPSYGRLLDGNLDSLIVKPVSPQVIVQEVNLVRAWSQSLGARTRRLRHLAERSCAEAVQLTTQAGTILRFWGGDAPQ